MRVHFLTAVGVGGQGRIHANMPHSVLASFDVLSVSVNQDSSVPDFSTLIRAEGE